QDWACLAQIRNDEIGEGIRICLRPWVETEMGIDPADVCFWGLHSENIYPGWNYAMKSVKLLYSLMISDTFQIGRNRILLLPKTLLDVVSAPSHTG
ncbi:MAG: hypothetical protein ACRD1J_03820, partial [Terriglobia bacterium]